MGVSCFRNEGFAVSKETVAGQVRDRINILKSEQVGLKTFIQSDQNLYEALEKAITELSWVLELLAKEEN